MKYNNIYLIALEKELNGKRKQCLINIILKRIQQPYTEDYSEVHHIIPESWDGPNCKDNKVRLSGREHYIVHKILAKCTIDGKKRSKMIHALHRMLFSESKNQKRYKPNSRQYNEARKIFSLNITKEKNPFFNKKHSDDNIKKFKEKNKGSGNPMYNKNHSEETIIKMSKNGIIAQSKRTQKQKADSVKKQLITRSKKSLEEINE